MLNIVVHVNRSVGWHKRYAQFFIAGFKKHGINVDVSHSITRLPNCDIAILLGPNSWKKIEDTTGSYIMVNRKFFGSDKNSADDVVALSWDGFNGHGYFCVDDVSSLRLERFFIMADLKDWNKDGNKILLCGQADLGRCKTYPNLNKWYTTVMYKPGLPIRFRHHPTKGVNRTFKDDLLNIKYAITLNSTVAIDILINGTPVVSMDSQSPVFGSTGHEMGQIEYPDRIEMLKYLAQCQYHHSEIQSGVFWEILNPKRGKKLNEISGF